MESAPEAVEAPSAAPRGRVSAGYNALVGAIARVPVPIRTKQLVGSLVVAALLALVAVLGFVALGQSNSRGTELRRLQERGGYEQLLLTDATQLKEAIDYRISSVAEQPSPDAPRAAALAFVRDVSVWYASAQDQTIGNDFNRLCLDAGATFPAPDGYAAAAGPGAVCLGTVNADNSSLVPNSIQPTLPLTLKAVAPSLWRRLVGCPPSASACGVASRTRPIHFGSRPADIFFTIDWSTGGPQWTRLFKGPIPASLCLGGCASHSLLVRADRWAASFAASLAVLTGQTKAGANALVATDRTSYSRSRNLLIGAGAGSLLLALVLGLLLSDSVLVPLRKTQTRLATIAAGDFSGHVEVPNRDEIGALAADVNRMSDELRRLYQELESASQHKSDFLATMSHELRTPLNAIIGFSEVLHEQMFGELNERQLADVEDVLAAGKHLLSLINDVLDLAKIEAGGMELELSEVAIPEVLRSAISMHAERASRGGVELSLTTEPDEITTSADERRVRQIVFNLVSNAVKFTPTQGRVEISARIDDGHVEVAVVDTGPGIAPEELETIFEEFKQATDGKRAEGTGLGLPLSRKLVELHGGRLWGESEVGLGSTFRFTLPVEQQT